MQWEERREADKGRTRQKESVKEVTAAFNFHEEWRYKWKVRRKRGGRDKNS